MLNALVTLRDVEGVFGSFVVDGQGGVLARDMPAVVDDHALDGAGRRVARLRAALDATGKRTDQCSLRFGGYLLVARAAESLTLCVLVSGQANTMALGMGTTLVARRVAAEGELARRARASSPPLAPVATPGPQVAPPAAPLAMAAPQVAPQAPPVVAPARAPEAVSPTRLFRGRPV